MHLGRKRTFQVRRGPQWLELLCKPFPDRYEQLVRYVGWYSSRNRGSAQGEGRHCGGDYRRGGRHRSAWRVREPRQGPREGEGALPSPGRGRAAKAKEQTPPGAGPDHPNPPPPSPPPPPPPGTPPPGAPPPGPAALLA